MIFGCGPAASRWLRLMIVTACARHALGLTVPSSRRSLLGLRGLAGDRLSTASSVSTHHQYQDASIYGRRLLRLLSSSTDLSEEQKVELEAKIKAKGDEIRALKEGGAEKSKVAPLVEELLALKSQLDPSLVQSKPAKNQPKQQKQQPKQNKAKDEIEEESDFITARGVDYSKWYNDLIRVTGLAETSPVRGCMVIKPWGMSLWDQVREELDAKIKEHGAENAYFPLLIPKSFLSKEAEHVDGFAKECAVVTHHRLTAGEGGLIADPEAELEDPLIIRPTSETMIWFMFRKWINSHRYVSALLLLLLSHVQIPSFPWIRSDII